MTKGSCLCGCITFELDPAGIALVTQCYCANCRKVSGSQFGTYLQVRPRNFRWLSGEPEVDTYESSPGNRRAFCRICGCVAPILTGYGAVRVPAGALDDDPGVRPDVVLHSEKKVEWCSTDAPANVFADSGPQDFWRRALMRLYVD